MRTADLEGLKNIMRDTRIHLGLAVIEKIEVIDDLSTSRVLCRVLPDEFEAVATVTYPDSSAGTGIFVQPGVGDLCLLAFVTPDDCYLLARLTSQDDPIPQQAKDGHSVITARPGKDLILGSAAKVLLGKAAPDAPATEPAVLGAVLLEAMGKLYDQVNLIIDKITAGPVGTGNLGNPVPTWPALVTSLNSIKTTINSDKDKYITKAETNVVSQSVFLER